MHVSLDIAAAVVDGICMSHGQKSIETHSSDTSRQIGFRFKGKRKKRVDLTVTAPDRCYCLKQASLTIRTRGRAGKFPVGGSQ